MDITYLCKIPATQSKAVCGLLSHCLFQTLMLGHISALPAVPVRFCLEEHWREIARLEKKGPLLLVSSISQQLHFTLSAAEGSSINWFHFPGCFQHSWNQPYHVLRSMGPSSTKPYSHASEAPTPAKQLVPQKVWIPAPWGPSSQFPCSGNSDFFPLFLQPQDWLLLLSLTVFVLPQCSPFAFLTLQHLIY